MDEFKSLIAEAKKQGWRVRLGKHCILYSPTGTGIVVIGLTPGDSQHAYANVLSMLKRHGFKPGKKKG